MFDRALFHQDQTIVSGARWSRVAAAMSRLSSTFKAWRTRRHGRATLASMPDYMLKDIGITRLDARRESAKWFWQP